ncbi:MAG: nucleoside recognition domain-containing protein [Bacteroidales bacterium]
MNTPLDKPSSETPIAETFGNPLSENISADARSMETPSHVAPSAEPLSAEAPSAQPLSVEPLSAEVPSPETVWQRVVRSVKAVTPNALKTAWWLVRIMVIVTLVITFLKYFGVIAWMSMHLTPVFSWFGLPGEAALAYVSGYFVNCYSAVAVIASLHLDMRSVTIISTMVLCSHNMILETAVQKKTGSSALRIVAVRTIPSLLLGWMLNKIMPGQPMDYVADLSQAQQSALWPMLVDWFWSTLRIAIPMVTLVFSLTVIQRLLSEFGIIRYIAKFLRPVMKFFGLPARTAFLWIVANTLGLAYGAAVMIDEASTGKLSRRDIDLLNHHIGISHSNVEDLLLFVAVGGSLPWMLLSRWVMSWFLVWGRRLETYLLSKLFPARFAPLA